MTDNYEFNRSMHLQNENEYSPYNDKQANNYINDINSGVYQNNGLSLVQFDLSSIYNSSTMTDTNDLFVFVTEPPRDRTWLLIPSPPPAVAACCSAAGH